MDEKGDVINLSGDRAGAESVEVAPSPRSRPMYLIIVSGAIPGARYAPAAWLDADRLPRENGLALQDLSISRRHATIVTDSEWGRLDHGPRQHQRHAFLNASPAPIRPSGFVDGDRVQLGGTLVVKFVRLDPCDEQFQRELFERTVRDPLTGLYNHGAFFLEQIAAMAELARRAGWAPWDPDAGYRPLQGA